ncbi:fibrinogen-like protein A isoform X2 [Armigeres subalbatus]
MATGLAATLIGFLFITLQISPLICDNCSSGKLRIKLEHLEQKILQIRSELVQNQKRIQQSLDKILQRLDHNALDSNAHHFSSVPALGENNRNPFETCSEVKTHKLPSGKYVLKLPGNGKGLYQAFCDQKTTDGGWLVIQNRVDGSMSFEKDWISYRKGFGEGDSNYWIGLENLHLLTTNRSYELRVELKDDSGIQKYASYDEFEIGSAAEYYKLKKLGTYNGTAGDSLKHHVGASFSTFDNDFDTNSIVNCAAKTRGGWWFSDCQDNRYCNLNGIFDGSKEQSIVWYTFIGSKRLKSSRMLLRTK